MLTTRDRRAFASLSILLFGASACRTPDVAAPVEDAPPPAASGVASSEDAPPAAASTEVTAADRWYPGGKAQSLKLTWAVYPSTGEGEAGPSRMIELVARIGNATKRLKLGTHTGYLTPSEQSLCTPSLRRGDVVSQLALNTMGPKTLFAKRTAPDKLEIGFHVDADPEERGVLGTLAIPADAVISEAISDIRGPQDEAPFDCKGNASDGRPKEPRLLTLSPTVKSVDTSDWKSAPAGSKLTATWTVDQSRAKPKIVGNIDDIVDRSKVTVPVDLQLSLGGRSHSVKVTGNAAVLTENPRCGELAFFWAGQRVAFELRRAAGGKVVLVRSVDFSNKPDQLFVFDVPSDVRVAQSVIVIDSEGKRAKDAKCSPATL
jgi:hypothetical protein